MAGRMSRGLSTCEAANFSLEGNAYHPGIPSMHAFRASFTDRCYGDSPPCSTSQPTLLWWAKNLVDSPRFLATARMPHSGMVSLLRSSDS